MTLRSSEKLKTSLVLVPTEGEFRFNFDITEVSKYLREPQVQQTPPGVQPPAMQITSLRDQIAVVLGPKLLFEDQNDDIPPTSGRLPEVATGFVRLLDRQGLRNYRAYGWNFDIAFDAPGDNSAAILIAETFLNQRTLSDRANIKSTGVAITIFFEQGAARCQLKLEPRFMDLNSPRFFASINYHYELESGQTVPGPDELRVAYNGLWGSFVELLDKLVRP